MSVYVDPLTSCIRNKNWKYDYACHMFADTLPELHSMAGKIGLKIEWFQSGGRLQHYDLTGMKREMAIKNGAVELTRRQAVETWNRLWPRKKTA